MIFLTAFFVAAEFSLVKIRKSRLETLEKENNKRAKLALNIVNHLDSYLSACQLGITLTSLAIGWVGESTMHSIFTYPLVLCSSTFCVIRQLVYYFSLFINYFCSCGNRRTYSKIFKYYKN
ncbi:CNNM domain-containing protein [Lactococcus lactis]